MCMLQLISLNGISVAAFVYDLVILSHKSNLQVKDNKWLHIEIALML